MSHFVAPGAAAVFARYEARRLEEETRVAVLDTADGPRLRDQFLLSVGPEVGGFLHALVLAQRPRRIIEIGTSYGYSTVFLADAAAAVGARLVTMELDAAKQAHARAEITAAGLAGVVDFRLGDAVRMLGEEPGPIDLVLMDLWKDLYVPCLHALYDRLAPAGIIVADNMIHPERARPAVREYRAALAAKGDLRSTLLPIGSGIEVSVRWPAGHQNL